MSDKEAETSQILGCICWGSEGRGE